MIKSDIVKIKKISGFDDIYIETELAKLGINPIRWAVVDVSTSELAISVSFVVLS